jgi:hypothetical protein
MTSRPDDVTKLDPLRKIGEEQQPNTTPGKGFESYMEKAGAQMHNLQSSAKTTASSPFDLARAQAPLASGPTFDSLLSQVKSSQVMLGDMNSDLNTKNLKLKQSQRYLLRSKLKNANGYLKAANVKMGAEAPAPAAATGGGILGKFVNYVADGQSNLIAAQQQLVNLKGKGDALKPADFLSIQLKLAHAQQEIEYASVMLSKAVDDMKTLMNIQL